MSATTTLSYAEIEALAAKALTASGVSPVNAGPVARSIAAAERDGQAIVGLSYLPVYCDHAACGKVDGQATPKLETLSPVAILNRGYALVFDASGKLIKDATHLKPGDDVSARLARGTVGARVNSVEPAAES